MDLFFEKIWLYVKPHIVTLIVVSTVCCVGYFLIKREREQFSLERSGYVDRIKELNENHDETIRKMNDSIEEERRQTDENIKKWKDALVEVQKKYEHDIEELNKKKNEQTKKLIQVYGEDPKGMAEQISAITGFKIIDPEKQK